MPITHIDMNDIVPLSWSAEKKKGSPVFHKVEIKPDNSPLICHNKITFGCDPEGFIFKGETPVPAIDIIPGTKAEPYKVNKGAVQVDGMAAEFNIDPVSTYEEWEENISTVIEELKKFLPKDHELRFVPTVKFDADIFDATPDEAKELGCQPDFDAWSGGVNPPPNPEDPYLRCAGGHIHFGWTENEDLSSLQHILNCQDAVKQLDWFLGAWSIYEDSDNTRRTLYGKSGACRYKEYGVEYRVLSNFWVNTPELRRQVWDRMVHAMNAMSKSGYADRVPQEYNTLLIEAINKGSLHKALKINCQYPLMSLDARMAQF